MSMASLRLIFTIVLVHLSAITCTDEVETVIQPDGEVTVKVQFKNLTVVQTSADGYNLMQVSPSRTFLPFIDIIASHGFLNWQGFEWIQSCYLLVI